MKLVRFAIFASYFTEAKKQPPTYLDCMTNGKFLDQTNVKSTSCNKKNKCKITCEDGYQKLGASFFMCKKQRCKYC